MSRKGLWWKSLGVLLLALAIFYGGHKIFLRVEQARVQDSGLTYLQNEVKFLMYYHGAKVARYQHGRWYFLSRRGRWLPMETREACRRLSLINKSSRICACVF